MLRFGRFAGFILVFFCLSMALAWGQTQLTHTQQHFTHPDGRLYWPADLPVYVFVASTPDAADKRQLESENPAYGNPMYLDTEGINWVRSSWAVNNETRQPVSPQVEVKFPVWRDGLAPITRITFESASRAAGSDNPFYGQGLKVVTTATDAGSGVAATYLSIDAKPYQKYTEPIALDGNARHVLRVYSVDAVGNVEEPQEFIFDVDVTAPVTKHTIDGEYSRNILSVRAKITLEAQDPASGISRVFYQLDSGGLQPYRGTIPFDRLADGEHTLTYYAVDRVGNEEETKSYSFYLDKTPPQVVATIIGDQYQNRGRVFISDRTTVELTATDNHSGVRSMVYRVDGGEEREYQEPFPLKKSEGSHVVEYYAVDAVGNGFRGEFREEYGGREALSLDMKAPDINFSFGGSQFESRDTAFITKNTLINLLAEDKDSGVRQVGYKINGGPGQLYEGPFTIAEEGFYIIDFFSTDAVNNRNTLEFYFVVDNTGPEIEHIFSSSPVGSITLDELDAPLKVYPKGLTLYLGATDAKVNTQQIYYSLNGKPEVAYTRPVKVEATGINTMQVRAVDELGNETKLEGIEFFVK